MKIKRICAGYYSWTYRGFEGTISQVEGEPYWYFLIGDGVADDWHSSYAITKLAIIDYIDMVIKNGENP